MLPRLKIQSLGILAEQILDEEKTDNNSILQCLLSYMGLASFTFNHITPEADPKVKALISKNTRDGRIVIFVSVVWARDVPLQLTQTE